MRDANHDDIVAEFVRLGWVCADLAYTGHGVPDLLVRDKAWERSRGSHLIEVKVPDHKGRWRTKNRRTREAQARFAEVFPVTVVTTLEDVQGFVRGWETEARG